MAGDNLYPPKTALENTPENDEPETPEEAAAVAEAWQEHKESKSLTTEELKRKLGLDFIDAHRNS